MPRPTSFSFQPSASAGGEISLEVEEGPFASHTHTHECTIFCFCRTSSFFSLIFLDHSISQSFLSRALLSRSDEFCIGRLLKISLLLRGSLFCPRCLCERINLLRPNYQRVTCAIPSTTICFLLTW